MSEIASVIKCEDHDGLFIWKHPKEDFNSMTQLIVHESQEAIFFMNGMALDTFGPGRHTLETENLPKIGKFLNRTTGGESPFHCEVYFINKNVQMSIKWGTDSKVRYIDPESGIPLEIGASGDMNLTVSDGRKLLVKLVGTTHGIAWENASGCAQSLKESFRPLISQAVKSNLTAAIKAQNINLLEVDEHLDALSSTLRAKILPGFEEYGLTIPQFYLTTVVLPESDPNFKKIRELHTIALQTRMAQAEAEVRKAQAAAQAEITAAQRANILEQETTKTEQMKREAERQVIAAQAEAAAMKAGGFAEAEIMQAKGYNQKDVIELEKQQAWAEGIGNMGSNGGSAGGGVASDMVSMMAGMKMAGAMMGQMDSMMPSGAGGTSTQPVQSEMVTCPNCGAKLPSGAKFCLECGAKVEVLSADEMICPACGKKTPKGKFCMECGASLVNTCPNCGKEVPAGGKFCLECGQKL